jgi:cytochrome c553
MVKKAILWGVCGLLTVGVAGAGYMMLRQPERSTPSMIRVEATPERLARGEYIFTKLADCDGCHSERDFSRFGGPVLVRGKGNLFPPELNLPGTVVAPNITPDADTGIGNWTDGEKIRAIREGISRDGRALFPMMPYQSFRNMSDEDVYSLVAYLNSLKPVRNPLPKTKLNFPVSVLIKSAPQPAGQVTQPRRENRDEYGKYLVTLAGCVECHTKSKNGALDESMLFAGGQEFQFPGGLLAVSANITPDKNTGIGEWDADDFVAKFAQYREYVEHGSPKVGPDGFTLMPWLSFSQLPDDELRLIFEYLQKQQPRYHAVVTHPEPAGEQKPAVAGVAR